MALAGLALGAAAVFAWAQTPSPPAVPQVQPATQPASAPVKKAATPKPAASSAKVAVKRATRPLWTELTEQQRQALAPLAPKWDGVNEAQKRKWLALSRNYPKMSADEQAKLHSRMTEWATLSPAQRTQARLNFGEARNLSPDDKQAKWEAYQALSPEEKRKLAAGAAKPPPTAPAVKPVPAKKLATVPQPTQVAKPPRIATGAHQVDPNTLLPQPAPAGQVN